MKPSKSFAEIENASPDEWLEEQNIMMGELANNLVFHKITCPRNQFICEHKFRFSVMDAILKTLLSLPSNVNDVEKPTRFCSSCFLPKELEVIDKCAVGLHDILKLAKYKGITFSQLVSWGSRFFVYQPAKFNKLNSWYPGVFEALTEIQVCLADGTVETQHVSRVTDTTDFISPLYLPIRDHFLSVDSKLKKKYIKQKRSKEIQTEKTIKKQKECLYWIFYATFWPFFVCCCCWDKSHRLFGLKDDWDDTASENTESEFILL